MSIIKSFNNTLSYIETVLDGEMDEREISLRSGYSYAMFSRLFSIMTNMTLSEYIRYRRLTEAALELRNGTERVIDIAIKYGYETSDSFGVAFKNFHGATPSDVRKGMSFQIVSPMQIALSVKGGRTMNVSIVKKPAFQVAGLDVQSIDTSRCSRVWENLFSKYSQEELAQLGTGESVGVCHDVKDPKRINYMAGYIIEDVEKAKQKGLDVLSVSPAEYAVVELQGCVPECIHNGWKYVMEVFFPEHGYMHSGQPDFEYYLEGDMSHSDYKMELWIPIVKV